MQRLIFTHVHTGLILFCMQISMQVQVSMHAYKHSNHHTVYERTECIYNSKVIYALVCLKKLLWSFINNCTFYKPKGWGTLSGCAVQYTCQEKIIEAFKLSDKILFLMTKKKSLPEGVNCWGEFNMLVLCNVSFSSGWNFTLTMPTPLKRQQEMLAFGRFYERLTFY